jgi:hypothetical protein
MNAVLLPTVCGAVTAELNIATAATGVEYLLEQRVGIMLTLLAPDIAEAIMDGRQSAELGVHVLRAGFPVAWVKQRSLYFGF